MVAIIFLLTASTLASFHLGYLSAKLSNGLPVELGMLDLLTVMCVGVILFCAWSVHKTAAS